MTHLPLGATKSGSVEKSLFRLLRKVPTTIGAVPTSIRDDSRMAEDRDAATDLINLPMMCHTYLAGSANFLQGLYRIMRPLPRMLEVLRMAPYPLIRGLNYRCKCG